MAVRDALNNVRIPTGLRWRQTNASRPSSRRSSVSRTYPVWSMPPVTSGRGPCSTPTTASRPETFSASCSRRRWKRASCRRSTAASTDALLLGDDGRQWPATIRAAAKTLIEAGARPSAVYLARQVQQVGDPALAEEVFDMALRDAPQKPAVRTDAGADRALSADGTTAAGRRPAAIRCWTTSAYAGSPALWYLAEAIADARGMTARAIGFRQRAHGDRVRASAGEGERRGDPRRLRPVALAVREAGDGDRPLARGCSAGTAGGGGPRGGPLAAAR